jgi:hypothetical protein
VHRFQLERARLLAVGLVALAIALLFLLNSGSPARAAEHKFCWNKVVAGGGKYCFDEHEYNIHAVYANSMDGAICVGVTAGGIFGCDKKANEGIYIGSPPLEGQYAQAYIWNLSSGSETVNGLVWDGAPPPPKWHEEEIPVAGGTWVEPAISSWGAGRLDLFERGTDNVMYHRAYSNQWLGWESLGGNLASGPSAVSWGAGRIDVVARSGADSSINHQWFQSGWGGPDNLGLTSDIPAISSWGPNRLDLFVRTTNNLLYHRAWNGFEWMGWEQIGEGLASGPDAVSWSAGRIDVVAEMADHSVGHWYWNGSSWTSDNLGGYVTAKPTIASQGENRLDVFARGVDNGLYHRWWAGAGWSNWEGLAGGTIATGPDAVSWGLNRVDVVAASESSHNILHWFFG